MPGGREVTIPRGPFNRWAVGAVAEREIGFVVPEAGTAALPDRCRTALPRLHAALRSYMICDGSGCMLLDPELPSRLKFDI